MKRKYVLLVLSVVTVCALFFALRKREYNIYIPDALGTSSKITIYAHSADAVEKCREYIYAMDEALSVSLESSEISRINRGETVDLSTDTEAILNLTMKYTDKDSFNPFGGALISLWDTARENKVLPDTTQLDAAITSSYPVSLNINEHSAHLENPKQKINLGAIAKGYITDGLNEILDEYDIESALIYLGGNVYAKGKKPDKTAWRVGICDPESPDTYLGIINAEDIAVITSGDYERYFEYDGEKYHHIIDPKTGYPANSGLRSVTIVCKNGALGDMLSTRCFIEGLEASKVLLGQYGAYAIFVTDDMCVYYSQELSSCLEISNDTYTWIEF